MKQRVCVVGGGPGGIVCVKQLLDEGHEAEAFEQESFLGGLFARGYDELLLTSSSAITSFSQYRADADTNPHFWTCGEYVQYLNDYVDHFGMRERFHLNTRVLEVRPGMGDEVIVTTQTKDMDPVERVFTRVVVASGLNHNPKTALTPELEGFSGEVIHSFQYKNNVDPVDMNGKRVLVVGGGESASDISYIIAKGAQHVSLSMRTGPGFLVPRYFNWSPNVPSDHDTSRLRHGQPGWLTHYFGMIRKFRIIPQKVETPEWYSLLDHTNDETAERFGAQGNSSVVMRTYGTKSESFCRAISEYGATMKPGVERVEGRTVHYTDGTSEELDVIVATTGYTVKFPFLEKHYPELVADAAANLRNLYKNMLHPSTGNKIVLVGFARPCFGAIPSIEEMQSRYTALLLSGACPTPPPDEMVRIARIDREVLEYALPRDKCKTSLRLFLNYQEELASLIGCRPNLLRLFLRHPIRFMKMYNGPLHTAQYRIEGPHADPALAYRVIDNTKLHYWQYNLNLWVFFLVCAFASLLSFIFPSLSRFRFATITTDSCGNAGVLPFQNHNMEEHKKYVGPQLTKMQCVNKMA